VADLPQAFAATLDVHDERSETMASPPLAFWSLAAPELLRQLHSSLDGLTREEAHARLTRYGANRLHPKKRTDTLALVLAQFTNPLILLLLGATALSAALHDATDAVIILAIVLASGLLGFWQERGASTAVEKLLATVEVRATAWRDGQETAIPVEEIVPGDVVSLTAGAIVPGDCLLLESKDLFVDEAALTGETYPVEKAAGVLAAATALGQRTSALWMGTHVVSGSARALVVRTGAATEFGQVSARLTLRPPETEFEHGVRRFSYFLLEVTLLLLLVIFAANVYLARPVLESFLFALALAVGMTPQLLPAIISVNLAHGAKRMAQRKVIVKRLASIENFGSMTVICSDKTGTLTEGRVHVHSAVDAEGAPSDKVALYAYLNAAYETGFVNPMDAAIRAYRQWDLAAYQRRDEIPYDFLRKRLSILVSHHDTLLLVTKGAVPNILAICTTAERADGAVTDRAAVEGAIEQQYTGFSRQGLRTLGVAYKRLLPGAILDASVEAEMTFLGFLVLHDPLKADIATTVDQLQGLGVSLKIVTGDNRLVARAVSEKLGLSNAPVLTGPELREMSDDALRQRAGATDVFAEIEPNQKERIILALRKAGQVVGYLGDGINDASALHAADVGISVDGGVDVAKEAADIVLLEKNLGVLAEGVREGRTTFANTLKYVFMATSSNFGTMFSMAGASLLLPFLPLLPPQVLLSNLLIDLPEMTIATDRVDAELVASPRRWNLQAIRQFMIVFGVLSSVFDYLTFGALLFVVHAMPDQFRTGWFVESVLSAALIVLVIRTRHPFFRSAPSPYLLGATLFVAVAVLGLPFLPLGQVFGFTPLPGVLLALIGLIILLYVLAAEMAKWAFYRTVRL
jgi:Mg2+-importing ATPase